MTILRNKSSKYIKSQGLCGASTAGKDEWPIKRVPIYFPSSGWKTIQSWEQRKAVTPVRSSTAGMLMIPMESWRWPPTPECKRADDPRYHEEKSSHRIPPRCEWCSHQHHKQEATSTTSGYLLRQILSLCPPSSTTSTGWGLTGSAALSPLTAFARLSLQLHLCSWIYDFRLQQSSAAFCIFSVFLFFTSSVFGLFWGFFAAQKDF